MWDINKSNSLQNYSAWQRNKARVANLGKYGKVNAVLAAKGLYLTVGCGFIFIELVGWESQDFQATFMQVVIHLPQGAEVFARL